MSRVPDIVTNDIIDAVRTAVQFGVSAEDFIQTAREHWTEELREKAERDDKAFGARA